MDISSGNQEGAANAAVTAHLNDNELREAEAKQIPAKPQSAALAPAASETAAATATAAAPLSSSTIHAHREPRESLRGFNLTGVPGHVLEQVARIRSVEDLRALLPYAPRLTDYQPGTLVEAWDRHQHGYIYLLTAEAGDTGSFPPNFAPDLSPQEMLTMGVFEGKYLNDKVLEFPREWFEAALAVGKLHPEGPLEAVNFYGIKSRESMKDWLDHNWIYGNDLHGWFEWYCRYWLGRRDPDLDDVQIQRWRDQLDLLEEAQSRPKVAQYLLQFGVKV